MHVPVLLKETLDFLNVKRGGRYIDATFGAGGHSAEIVKRGGIVLGIDWDANNSSPPSLLQREGKGELKLVHGNFADIREIAKENDFAEVDGILFDLGLSSEQLGDAGRGFSFQKDGPLDMRMGKNSYPPPLWKRGGATPSLLQREGRGEFTAADIVNQYSEKQLVQIFYDYGEERRFGKRVARGIVGVRKLGSIKTTVQLFDIIKRALPANLRFRAGDTARRIFQALRIEVNRELENLEKALPQAVTLLGKNGRLVVISFHSLEDRIVKNFLAAEARGCVCPPEFPECRCGHVPRVKILTKKPVRAGEEEIKQNSRSKSAKLRAAEKIGIR